MLNKKVWILFLFFIYTSSLQATSLVYILKIRRLFPSLHDILLKQKGNKPVWFATSVPIALTSDTTVKQSLFDIDSTEKRWLVGSLFDFRFYPKETCWLQLTTGLEHEKLHSKGMQNFSVSRTGLDDIVLSGGYSFIFKNGQFIIYGLAGGPTRRQVSSFEVADPLVGTRFYGAAIGTEFSYSFLNRSRQDLLLFFQNRFLHFFDRKFQPILPPNAKIQPGNWTDILLALRYRYKKNFIEVSYNPTFFTHQAFHFPERIAKVDSFIHHSFYCRLNHVSKKLAFFDEPALVGTGFLITRSKKFNTKIVTWWINGTVAF